MVVTRIYYWILTPAGQVVSCANVLRLTNLEQNIESHRKKTEEYYEAIETFFDVKYSNADVYGIIIQEIKLLNIDMED